MDLVNQIWSFLLNMIDLFLHLDIHLNNLVITFGPWVYLIAFLVVFCETGLVVTPLLPGDSLLFALGALAAIEGSPLQIGWLAVLLVVAPIMGDSTNYVIGRKVGPKVFSREDSWLLNKKYLEQTREFYVRYGGKTVILARFVPIVRTFAPFVAGIGRMPYRRFLTMSVCGSFLWVPPFLFAGYFMGNVPAVKTNFHIVIVAILVISVMPAVVEYLRARKRSGLTRSTP